MTTQPAETDTASPRPLKTGDHIITTSSFAPAYIGNLQKPPPGSYAVLRGESPKMDGSPSGYWFAEFPGYPGPTTEGRWAIHEDCFQVVPVLTLDEIRRQFVPLHQEESVEDEESRPIPHPKIATHFTDITSVEVGYVIEKVLPRIEKTFGELTDLQLNRDVDSFELVIRWE